jgi:DNA-binding NarL/FixJ family response regulator
MRVLVVDDSILIRAGVLRLLTARGHEVHTTDTPEAALAAVEPTPPDVAVVDIKLPPTYSDEGLRLANDLRRRGVPVLVLSQYAVPSYATALLADGASGRGYLLKERLLDASHLDAALRRVQSGGTVIDAALADAVAQAAGRRGSEDALTPRELEILALLAQGLSDRGIADTLVISVHTVSTHVQHVFRKLGLPDGATDNRRVLAAMTFLERWSDPGRNTTERTASAGPVRP